MAGWWPGIPGRLYIHFVVFLARHLTFSARRKSQQFQFPISVSNTSFCTSSARVNEVETGQASSASVVTGLEDASMDVQFLNEQVEQDVLLAA